MTAIILPFTRGPFNVRVEPERGGEGWMVVTRGRTHGWLHGDRSAALADARSRSPTVSGSVSGRAHGGTYDLRRRDCERFGCAPLWPTPMAGTLPLSQGSHAITFHH